MVLLYQFWEDQFRGKIAETLHLEKNALADDVFGELNAIRQSIIHNHGRANAKAARATGLKAFPQGQPIQLEPEDVRALVVSVKSAVRRVVRIIPSAAS